MSGDLQLKRPSIGLTVGFWLIVAVFATAARWSELQQLMFGSPDDLARLVQVRDLLAGQSWWDLTQERIGSSGVEMHWSRHLDGLVSVVVLLLRPIIGAKSAELIALILVPLGLLLAFLWLVSSIGRLLTPLRDAGLYAMVAGALGVGVLHRFLPGALDHHGLQIVLVLTVVWAVITTPSRRAAVIAGVAAGLAPTVGLETVPILAGVIAGLGIEWAIGGGRPRGFFQSFGFAFPITLVSSAVLFAPPGRLLSTDCDVLSLGFAGVMVIPVIILGFLGGKSWRPLSRWTALCVGGVGAILWLISVSPQCLAGPYAEVPDQAHQIWLIQITEVQGFLEVVGRSPAFALSMALAPVAAILFVGREVLVSRRSEYLPLLLGLLVAIGLAVWQVRMVPLTAALAAPIIAVIALRLRERFSWEMGRAAAPVLVVLLLSGIVTTFFEEATRAETGGSEVVGACVNGRLLEGLRAHGPDLVLAEIDLGPTLLVHTDHSVLASPYHRAFEGVLASYDILVGDIEEAEQRVNAAQVSYVVVCDGTAWAGNWAADNPDGLFSRLLSDNPPDWLAKVVDAGRSRVYSVK